MTTTFDICPSRDDAQRHIVEDGRCVLCLAPIERDLCCHCGEPMTVDETIAVSELPVDTDSANAGESAVLCCSCATALGIAVPTDERVPAEPTDLDTYEF